MKLLLLMLFVVVAAVPAEAQATRIGDVAWIQGCWEMSSSDRLVEEQWTKPRAGTMLGSGRTTTGSALVEHEFIVLREQGDALAYEAHPSGQTPTVFLSRPPNGLAAERIVFENLEHAFPQRVGYERRGPDGLLAWIEGTRNGQSRRIEFAYQRANCVEK